MSMDSSFAMKGGDGPTSYSQNSSFQGSISDQAKALLVKGIQQNIVLPADPNCTMHRTFRIADLGCSVGSNTVACVQTIMEAVKAKYKAEGIRPETLEFQVFFNDQGLVDEALIDSFNMPVFVPTAAEVREVASKIECLSVEVVKKICLPRSLGAITQHPRSLPRLLQAVTEDVVVKHFGPATSDLFYSRLPKKIEERSLASPPPACLVKLEEFENLFMLLRKNAVSN
ncbi:hypothetical protein CRG98_019787 [Punica granatum]|uniref:Uncharacterized protein n=1 Tax=Punica granatum TaxID=22663 RepID=A0A2I0JU41_PUNGR|nr:hypothetical protein CRG98_019787 [Punica granatum]